MTKAPFAPPRQKADRRGPAPRGPVAVPIAEATVPPRTRGVVGPATGAGEVSGREPSDAAKGVRGPYRRKGGVRVPPPRRRGQAGRPLGPRVPIRLIATGAPVATVVPMQAQARHRAPLLPLAAPEVAAWQGTVGGVTADA